MKKLTVLVAFVLGVICLSISLGRAELVSGEQVAVDEPAAQTDTSPSQECDEAAPADNLLAKAGCCSWHGGVCGCSGGRALCCDGALSPTCGC